MKYTDGRYRWVDDKKKRQEFAEHESCPCGSDKNLMGAPCFWFKSTLMCTDCERVFVFFDNENMDLPVPPKDILSQYDAPEEETIEKLDSDNVRAFELLSGMSESEKGIEQYVEFHPMSTDIYDTYLLAKDGLYIGYIVHQENTIKGLFLLAEYREEGLGTNFVENWFDMQSFDEIGVWAWDDVKDFYRQLDIPITNIDQQEEA